MGVRAGGGVLGTPYLNRPAACVPVLHFGKAIPLSPKTSAARRVFDIFKELK